MNRVSVKLILTLGLWLAAGWAAAADPDPFADQREQARESYNKGNYADAYEQYGRFIFDPALAPVAGGNDFHQAVNCLQQLNRDHESDALRERMAGAHTNTWQLIRAVGDSYRSANHYGVILEGAFERGHHRGGGEHANVVERDRIRALQLFEQALALVRESGNANERAGFYIHFASVLMDSRGHWTAWKLNLLSDTTSLPDPEKGYPHRVYGGGNSRGAPVDESGKPLFHALPESYESAASDGERWRWLLWRAMEIVPTYRPTVLQTFATFLHQQFGVQTMADYGWFFHRSRRVSDEDPDTDTSGTYELHTLHDDETIARLATGIRRFNLPDEYNFVSLFRELASGSYPGYEEHAHRVLADIYANRRQYPEAASWWRANIREFGEGHNKWKVERLEQIVESWGRFEPTMTQEAGTGAVLQYTFRNGSRAAFTAHRIKIPLLLENIKRYLKSNPVQLQWDKINIESIGHRIVTRAQKKYLGKQVASWSLDLDPAPDHFDRRIDIPTPLRDPGAYLVTARIAGGNVSKIVVWVNDTVIVKKPMAANMPATRNTPAWYYVGDARNGAPVANANVEFFVYWQEHLAKRRGKRYADIRTSQFAAFGDALGQVTPPATDLIPGEQNPQVIAIATTPEGRFAFLGFSRVWRSPYYDAEYNQQKGYAITDRPVYRPGDEVKFKAWMRHAKYDREDTSDFAGKSFSIVIHNPKGDQVFSETFTADDYGGMSGTFALEEEMPLGVYTLQVGGYGSVSFRVEEYKKPEFEVVIESPDEPVMLGEEIPVAVQADYYFGAPVKNADVKYKVMRTTTSAQWYPPSPWDWFYGPGYWWYGYDYDWYPGWWRWGCFRPHPFWWPEPSAPPELVAEGEARIGDDGRFTLTIDTSVTKAMHGDKDHTYEITAEVTDSSRRTIVGQSQVLAARRPFKVFAWVDRGHYRVGDTVRAEFAARTLDGKPVQGEGTATLYRVTYDDQRRPIETAVQRWDLATNDRGQSSLQLTASRGGQYRLSYTLTDAAGHAIEGGYVFTVRGEGFDGRRHRFSQLELVTDKRDYAPGDEVRLMINTDAPDSTVLLFVRPANGVYLKPRILSLNGQSVVEPIAITKKDMPNFFVEAITIHDGKVHTEVREIAIPPEERVLDVALEPSSETYGPGESATVGLSVTDADGNPFTGSLALAVYDRALDYIAGGAAPPDIREFFWKWRRSHNPNTEHNLGRHTATIYLPDQPGMSALGVFGGGVADEMNGSARWIRAVKSLGRQNGRIEAKFLELDSLEAGMALADASMAAATGSDPAEPEPAFVEAAVRSAFADTAFWTADLFTDETGRASVQFDMPENLTGWSIRTWAVGHGTRVGEQSGQVVTRKDLMVRLQAPRFFVEKDEIVLSAVIHNELESRKIVRAILELDGETVTALDETIRDIEIDAHGEARVDWRVKAVREGDVTVRMKALTDEESDAMEMTFPVYVHGIPKTMSFSAVIRPDEDETTIAVTVPMERRPDETELIVRFSPSLAAAMVDALPYLVDYPYGCTEQTLSRFLPTVLTQNILKDLGVDLAAVRDKRTNLNAQEIGDPADRAAQWKRFDRNPVFDEEEVNRMVKEGLKALYDMQLNDGGWGWFSGWGERSYPHTTAYVLHGFQVAEQNGLAIVPGTMRRGIDWLKRYQREQIKDLRDKDRGKSHADALDAFVFMVLQDAGHLSKPMYRFLKMEQARLPVYGKAMVALCAHKMGDLETRDEWKHTIEQHLVQDAENQTAWLNLQNGSYWWYWYGSEYEAHAYYLKLLSHTEPDSDKARGLVKYLINNRKHGTYWNSTRDTAVCLEAMADYLRASRELSPDQTIEIWIDGRRRKQVRFTGENLFTVDNTLTIRGAELEGGDHAVTIKKQGRGPLYANAYLSVFSLEDPITAAGLEIKVGRKFYRLKRVDASTHVAGHRGQAVAQNVEKYERQPIGPDTVLKSGDLVEIELAIESKNDYEYLVFEDRKAAGFEPIEVRSGYNGNAMNAYVEYRDERVSFFVRRLARGRHSVAYRMRAEIPGRVSALPAHGYAMYAPELKANADEMKLVVEDK